MPNRTLDTGRLSSAQSSASLTSRFLAGVSMVLLLITFVSGVRSFAQDTPKPDQTNQQPAKPAGQGDTSVAQHVGNTAMQPVKLFTLLDRKSYFFPDIASTSQSLSSGQKFELAVNNSISGHAIMGAALGAAISQADDSPTGRGQGWNAFGERFGSSMARQASSELFGTFILASVLHQDPRFFPRANLSFGQSTRYSVTRLFVTRNDSGREVANVSGLLGPLFAEGLANVYWPDRNRTVGDTFLRYGLDLATRAGGNMLREYWPVMMRKVGRTTTTTSR
jgi:hypothetical protein